MKDEASGDNGYFITVLINVILLGLIFLFAWMFRGFSFSFNMTAFIFFVLSGIGTTALGRLTLFASILRIGPSRASALKNGAPMFTVLFALLFLGEFIAWGPAIGIAVMLAGILFQGCMLFRQNHEGKALSQTAEEKANLYWQMFGYGFGILSAVAFGVGQGLRKQGLLLMNDAFFGAFVGAVTSLVFVCLYEAARGQFRTVVRKSFGEVNRYYLLAGVMTTMGPLFFFLGSSLTQVSYVSVVAATEPLLTVLISKWMLKQEEPLPPSVWTTVSLIFCGTVLMITTS
ncbi:EamA family transporter [Brevibacillus sp. TJ4]|uniref:EamA family transporter n=1 Tax=Brevibacillus sp. TJ4 TaxID=3234853 RepID=UPI0037D71F8C